MSEFRLTRDPGPARVVRRGELDANASLALSGQPAPAHGKHRVLVLVCVEHDDALTEATYDNGAVSIVCGQCRREIIHIAVAE